MSLITKVICLLSLVAIVFGRGISSLQSAACTYAVSNATHSSIDCNSPLFVGSVVLCIEEYASNRSQITKAYRYLQDVCEYQLKRKLDPNELDDHLRNATKYMNHEYPLDYIPIQVSRKLYNMSYTSVDNLLLERKKGTLYGLLLFGYWGVLILLSVFVNVFQWCCPILSSEIKQYRMARWIRRTFLTAITMNQGQRNKRQNNWNKKLKLSLIKHLPPRVHIISLSLYTAMVIILCSINYDIHSPNIVFRCTKGQRLVWIADRTGIIAIIQLPLIYLFTSRNNLLSPVSCFSYKTFNILHKWISRIVWVLLCVHALCYLGFATTKGDYIARWGLTKWRFANIGLISVSISILIAVCRKQFYEFFKATHKILIALFTVGIWYHCISLGWIEYIYACIAIWVQDYVARIAKIISSGGVLKAKCSCIFETIATGKGYENIPHTLRVEVNYSSWWRQYPGAYAWVYFLDPKLFWQAHPFTLISPSTSENHNQLIFNIRVKSGLTKTLGQMSLDKPNYEMTIPVLIEGPYGSTRPYKSYRHAVFLAGGVGFTPLYSIAVDLSRCFQGEASRDGLERNISITWICPDFETVFSFQNELAQISRFSYNIQMHIFISRFHELEMKDLNSADMTLQNRVVLEEETEEEAVTEMEARADSGIGAEAGNDHVPEASAVPGEDIIQALKFPDLGSSMAREQVFHHPAQLRSQYRLIHNILEDQYQGITLTLNSRPNVEDLINVKLANLTGPTAVVACGPQGMCLVARAATAECIGRTYANRVDYFEEDLLW